MKVDFEDGKRIIILVDLEKNIVIFPISKTDFPVELPDGTWLEYSYQVAYFPIELQYPYTNAELAEKIKFGIEHWDKHKCYGEQEKKTFEEKFYGIKGFKNAVKGNLYIDLGWNDKEGKYVWLSMPSKRGYAYIALDNTKLPDDADWIDFANAVVNYINLDVTTLRTFKSYKNQLNI